MLRRAAVVAILALDALVGGCGKTVLNTAKGEKRIADVVRQRTGKSTKVSCPRDVPIEKGRTTLCTIRGRDGSRGTMRMVQTDGKGNVRIRGTLLGTAGVERRIATDASDKLAFAVTIDCPDVVELTDAAKRIRCVARDPHGNRAPVTVDIDAQGAVTYKIPPAG